MSDFEKDSVQLQSPEGSSVKAVGRRTTMTLSISEEDKYAVKRFALEHGVTVSDLLHMWIERDCHSPEKGGTE